MGIGRTPSTDSNKTKGEAEQVVGICGIAIAGRRIGLYCRYLVKRKMGKMGTVQEAPR